MLPCREALPPPTGVSRGTSHYSLLCLVDSAVLVDSAGALRLLLGSDHITHETPVQCLAGWLQGEGSGLGVFLSAHMNLSHGRVREDWAHHHRNSVRRMQQDTHKPAGKGDALPVSPPGLHVDVSRQHVQRSTCLSFFNLRNQPLPVKSRRFPITLRQCLCFLILMSGRLRPCPQTHQTGAAELQQCFWGSSDLEMEQTQTVHACS